MCLGLSTRFQAFLVIYEYFLVFLKMQNNLVMTYTYICTSDTLNTLGELPLPADVRKNFFYFWILLGVGVEHGSCRVEVRTSNHSATATGSRLK